MITLSFELKEWSYQIIIQTHAFQNWGNKMTQLIDIKQEISFPKA